MASFVTAVPACYGGMNYDSKTNSSNLGDDVMSDHVYKIIEITGTSKKSIEDAVNSAVAKASESLKNIRWVEVTDVRGNVEGAKIDHWQVTVKLGFTLNDGAGD